LRPYLHSSPRPTLEEGRVPMRGMDVLKAPTSMVVLLICGVALAGCGALSGPGPEASTKPELTTVAGDGGSKLGDGGPAKSAGFCGPNDVAFDTAGNMYISDGGIYCTGPGGYTVRKVDPHGTITIVAGTGEAGFSGDGGPATKAQLDVPIAVAVDREGNLYITDESNYRIRKVDKDGIIHTVAGTGKKGYSGDGGPATEAALNDPVGIAVDGEANVFFSDHHNNVVRKIDRKGKITTVAGTGTDELVSTREKGPARKVMLNGPWGLFLGEHSRVLYIADIFNHRIRALRLEEDA
jgi:trimeric autotransporter adhesin